MKISSQAVFKIISGFATVLALAGGAGTYFSYKLSQQAQASLAQQTEELESAGAKIKELEGKVKELQTKNDDASAALEKFTSANKELTTQLEELNKEIANYESMQKKNKAKPKHP
jgi:septal ring factor EnvC (AmiA/AmiB activator)